MVQYLQVFGPITVSYVIQNTWDALQSIEINAMDCRELLRRGTVCHIRKGKNGDYILGFGRTHLGTTGSFGEGYQGCFSLVCDGGVSMFVDLAGSKL